MSAGQTLRREGGPAIIYGAKSTTDDRGSIPTQLQDGRDLAEREELQVVETYSDASASAFKGNRGPNLARAPPPPATGDRAATQRPTGRGVE